MTLKELFVSKDKTSKYLSERSLSRAFFAFVVAGLSTHAGAATLTLRIIGEKAGVEANPLYYYLGKESFMIFGAVGMLIYYITVWKCRITWSQKVLCASALTCTATFDFSHDLSIYLIRAVGYSLGIHL